jgi:protein SCO1/2
MHLRADRGGAPGSGACWMSAVTNVPIMWDNIYPMEKNTNPGSKVPLIVLVASVALLAGITASWLFGIGARQRPQLTAATVLWDHARPLPEFSLVDGQGQAFGPKQLKGRWTFLFFGYTHCPDVCPTTLATLNQAMEAITRNGDAEHTQVVFVSVDPGRDDPQQLGQYVRFFNPDFKGVTGSGADIDTLATPLGIVHARVANPNDAENYLVDHTASVLLVSPEGALIALFGAPQHADAMARDFHALRAYYQGQG